MKMISGRGSSLICVEEPVPFLRAMMENFRPDRSNLITLAQDQERRTQIMGNNIFFSIFSQLAPSNF